MGHSDHLAVLHAFDEWRGLRNRGYRQEEDRLCWRKFLNRNVLEMMADMRLQFLDLLHAAGFIQSGDGGHASSGAGRKFSEFSECSQRAREESLVRAVICAGLFPKVASVRNGKRKAKWHTLDDGKVDPHPSSVNFRESQFEYEWMVYNEKVRPVSCAPSFSSSFSF